VKNGRIITFTGGSFYPLEPRAEDIDPIDIAHALSQQCRYTGHTKFFYSVATHCCIIHDWLEDNILWGIESENGKVLDKHDTLLWSLVHDADETYLFDLAAPIKHHPDGFGDRFVEAAQAILVCVAERFDLSLPEPAIVKKIDVQLRETEMECLFPPFVERNHWGDPLPVTIHDWPPVRGEYEYLLRLSKLGIVERNTGWFQTPEKITA